MMASFIATRLDWSSLVAIRHAAHDALPICGCILPKELVS